MPSADLKQGLVKWRFDVWASVRKVALTRINIIFKYMLKTGNQSVEQFFSTL